MKPDLKALYKYLDGVGNFQWHTNDCYQFTTRAWEVMYGFPWSTGWKELYTDEFGRYRTYEDSLKVFGVNSLEEAIDRHLERTRVPPKRGCLVTAKADLNKVNMMALGISVGHKAAFLQKRGVVYLPISQVQNAWTNK